MITQQEFDTFWNSVSASFRDIAIEDMQYVLKRITAAETVVPDEPAKGIGITYPATHSLNTEDSDQYILIITKIMFQREIEYDSGGIIATSSIAIEYRANDEVRHMHFLEFDSSIEMLPMALTIFMCHYKRKIASKLDLNYVPLTLEKSPIDSYRIMERSIEDASYINRLFLWRTLGVNDPDVDEIDPVYVEHALMHQIVSLTDPGDTADLECPILIDFTKMYKDGCSTGSVVTTHQLYESIKQTKRDFYLTYFIPITLTVKYRVLEDGMLDNVQIIFEPALYFCDVIDEIFDGDDTPFRFSFKQDGDPVSVEEISRDIVKMIQYTGKYITFLYQKLLFDGYSELMKPGQPFNME